DDLLHLAHGDAGQRARAAGVVERPTGLGDVGDPVLELGEHVRAVVDAQAVAGAEVLIDPDTHAEVARYPQRYRAASAMTETPPPRVAPRKAHTWPRPTGPVEDPYAWLRNREDPDTVAYLEAENAYSGAWFEAHAELVEAMYGEIKSRVQET